MPIGANGEDELLDVPCHLLQWLGDAHGGPAAPACELPPGRKLPTDFLFGKLVLATGEHPGLGYKDDSQVWLGQ